MEVTAARIGWIQILRVAFGYGSWNGLRVLGLGKVRDSCVSRWISRILGKINQIFLTALNYDWDLLAAANPPAKLFCATWNVQKKINYFFG